MQSIPFQPESVWSNCHIHVVDHFLTSTSCRLLFGERRTVYLVRGITDVYSTIYVRLSGSCVGRGSVVVREREMFYLTTHSTHFIYGYMASDIWLRTILIVRKETRCRHIGYSYRLTARVILYAPSHRQDNTYHSLCYTSRGAQAGTRISSMGVRGEVGTPRV